MNFITGKYIFISHAKQLSVEKYDYPFNFESLSFFVPAGYVLENPTNIPSSSLYSISNLLCDNRLNLDRISKVPINGKIKLRKMAFTVSDKDKLQGNEIFYYNAGLYYCDSNKQIIKILDWEQLKLLGIINFKKLIEIINNHAYQNSINPQTTGIFLYTCRSSCVEPKKGHIAPILIPIKGQEKIIGTSGPSIRQLKNTLIIKQPKGEQEETQIISGGNTSSILPIENIVNVDETIFYEYNSIKDNKLRRERIRKMSKSLNKYKRYKSNHGKLYGKLSRKYKLSNKYRTLNKNMLSRKHKLSNKNRTLNKNRTSRK